MAFVGKLERHERWPPLLVLVEGETGTTSANAGATKINGIAAADVHSPIEQFEAHQNRQRLAGQQDLVDAGSGSRPVTTSYGQKTNPTGRPLITVKRHGSSWDQPPRQATSYDGSS
jgi:hypothetical protein